MPRSCRRSQIAAPIFPVPTNPTRIPEVYDPGPTQTPGTTPAPGGPGHSESEGRGAAPRHQPARILAFPKEEREALVASDPGKFRMPATSDLRYHWVEVRLDAIGRDELRELVIDAWRMVVPKRLAATHLGAAPAS
jgi:hypothetical protein